MAAREHRVSRRALLGAAFFPLISSGAARSGGDACYGRPPLVEECPFPREAWTGALRRLRHAEAVLKAAVHEPDERLYGDLVLAFNRALRTLLRTPAPDLPTLAAKLALAIDQAAWELTDGEACMAALMRDADRLCRG